MDLTNLDLTNLEISSDFVEKFDVLEVSDSYSSEPSSVFYTEELLHALSILKIFVPSSGEIVSRTVQLKFSGDLLTIIANNRRQYFSYSLKSKNKINLIEGTWFVPLDFLVSVVRKVGKNISFFVTDSELKIKFFNGFLNFETFILSDDIFDRKFNTSDSFGKFDLSNYTEFFEKMIKLNGLAHLLKDRKIFIKDNKVYFNFLYVYGFCENVNLPDMVLSDKDLQALYLLSKSEKDVEILKDSDGSFCFKNDNFSFIFSPISFDFSSLSGILDFKKSGDVININYMQLFSIASIVFSFGNNVIFNFVPTEQGQELSFLFKNKLSKFIISTDSVQKFSILNSVLYKILLVFKSSDETISIFFLEDGKKLFVYEGINIIF